VPVVPASSQGTARSWALKLGGGNVTRLVPLDQGAIRITESLGSPASMEFVIEDTASSINLLHGSIVTMERTRRSPLGESQSLFRYFGGHLIETEYTRLAGSGRLITCRAIGFEAWLDWRYVINYSSRTDVNGRIRRVFNDRTMVQQLVSQYGALLTAPGSTVDTTNTVMEVVAVKGVTLREALETVADVATVFAPTATRDFYVDHYGRVHYYSGSEALTAALRIADGSYTRMVLDESGLRGLFTLGEADGATAFNAPTPGASTNGTWNGTYNRGGSGLVLNEPAYTSTRITGAGYLALPHADYHPGDTFTVECVFKRGTLGSTQTLVSAGSGDYLVQFNSSNQLVIQREGVGDHFVSDDTFTDFDVHHFMWSRAPGDTDVYLDGEALTGTTTARTFVQAGGDVNWGRKVSTGTEFFNGWLSHIAHYTTKKTATDAEDHANQLKSLTPEGLTVSRTSADRVHRVYVRGANKQGSGWVHPGGTNFAGFYVDAELDQPDSTTPSKRNAYGRAFINQHGRIDSIRYSVTHAFSGWKLGQQVYITDSALGLDNSPQEVRELVTDFNLGNGQITYEMVLGEPRPAHFRRGRRRRRR
jgi:hypothetical protein